MCTVSRLQLGHSRSGWGEALPQCRRSGGSGNDDVCSLQHPAVAPVRKWRHRGRRRELVGRSSHPEVAASGGKQPVLRGHRQSRHARQLTEERHKERWFIYMSKSKRVYTFVKQYNRNWLLPSMLLALTLKPSSLVISKRRWGWFMYVLFLCLGADESSSELNPV